MRVALIPCILAVLLQGCRSAEPRRAEPTPPPPASPEVRRQVLELFEELGVRIDTARRSLEFDAFVAMDCHDPETPDVYLEVVCCTPDTREHESLLVTRVLPSSVHAALNALGLEPGRPAAWSVVNDGIVREPARGPRLRVEFLLDGETHDPAAWITRGAGGPTLRKTIPATGWVFAGSVVRERAGREVYDADGSGALIGLHTFGNETIAWTRVESPESVVDEPLWLVNNAVVPAMGTPVTVRLTPE